MTGIVLVFRNGDVRHVSFPPIEPTPEIITWDRLVFVRESEPSRVATMPDRYFEEPAVFAYRP